MRKKFLVLSDFCEGGLWMPDAETAVRHLYTEEIYKEELNQQHISILGFKYRTGDTLSKIDPETFDILYECAVDREIEHYEKEFYKAKRESAKSMRIRGVVFDIIEDDEENL